MKINRRELIERTVGAGLAAAALTARETAASASEDKNRAEETSLIPIVDTHQHLWDLSRIRPPWLKPGGELTRSYVSKDYLEAVRGLNVVKTVYMEVAVDDGQLVDEVEYVLPLCKDPANLMSAAVIGGRPASEGFREYITRFKDSSYIKGVRHIRRRTEELEEEGLIAGLRLLGELGMCFDLCPNPEALVACAKVVDRCPDTRFVLDHCGNADPIAFYRPDRTRPRAAQHDADKWRRDIAALAKRKNVVCKISGIVARVEKGNWSPADLAPIVNHCLEVFGPDRVMFAGDWPVCTRGAPLRDWINALVEIVRPRSKEHQRKLFHDNAVRFYGLS